MSKRGRLKDGRKQDWFWIDNEVIDNHAAELGPHATLVYFYIVRKSDGDDTAWPSYNKIAKALGIGRSTAKNAVATLIERGLLSSEARVDEEGDATSNLYTILAVAKHKNEDTGGGSGDNPPRSGDDRGVGQEITGGGSGDNPYQYPSINTQLDQGVVEGNVTHLDGVDGRCLQLLKDIPYFPRDEAHVVKKLREYRATWPGVEAAEVCADYKAYCEEKTKKKPTLLQLRNFFKQAAKSAPAQQTQIRSRKVDDEPPTEAEIRHRREDAELLERLRKENGIA